MIQEKKFVLKSFRVESIALCQSHLYGQWRGCFSFFSNSLLWSVPATGTLLYGGKDKGFLNKLKLILFLKNVLLCTCSTEYYFYYTYYTRRESKCAYLVPDWLFAQLYSIYKYCVCTVFGKCIICSTEYYVYLLHTQSKCAYGGSVTTAHELCVPKIIKSIYGH